MTDTLRFDVDGAVARITLNRPDVFNAMNRELRDALKQAIQKIHVNDEIRVVILTGNGPGFSAGTDLSEKIDGPASLMLEQEYRPILSAIASSPKIWIAQVHGSAAGIGAALAMNCDLMTMSDSATLYMAFAAIGLVPDGGSTWLLHRGLGYKRTLQAILEGRKTPAAEAVDLGLANSIHPTEQLAEETLGLARRIAEGAPLANAATKRLLRAVDGMSYDNAFAAEAREQTDLFDSKDFREGVQAFFEKRKPNFKGA